MYDNFPWKKENGWNEPLPTTITLTNPTETEDDGINDAKGVADKTNFTFSVKYTGATVPNSIHLSYKNEDNAFLGTYESAVYASSDDYVNGVAYSKTLNFPKGHYSYFFEVTTGDTTITTEEKHFTTGYSNVAFLPGLEASRLYNSSGNMIWEPKMPTHDNSQLYMKDDGTSAQSGIYVGEIINNSYNIPSKGNIYWSFINKMNEMKTDGTIAEWQPLPYDWRNNVEDVVNNPIPTATGSYSMISEIHQLAESSDTGKVTIIAHSNGGLVAKMLSTKLGDDAKLFDQMIFVAVPEVGTPSAVGAILHGFQTGIPFDSWLNQIITPTESRTLAKNMGSAYGLLPSANYFTYTDDEVITFADDPLLSNWRLTYGTTIHSGERLRNFLVDQTRQSMPVTNALNNPNIGNSTLLTKAETLHSTLDNWTPPTNVELTEIAGWGEETLKTIEYYQGVQTGCETVAGVRACNFKPVLEFNPKMTIDGDGTVVTSSALWTPGANKYWINIKKYNVDRSVPIIFNRYHSNILEIAELLDFTKNLIIRNNATLPQYISTSAPQYTGTESRLHFTLHSPLSLTLTDEAGNRTGISPDGTVEENIPGSRYVTFGDVKYISVPSSAKLHLEMKGYETGSFTLKVEEKQDDTSITETTFAGIPSNSLTTVTMNIPANGGIVNASPLTVDENGDGTIDMIFTVKLGETVLPDFTNPEAKISVDPNTKDLKIEGVDENPTTVSKSGNTYTITDSSGNKTTLFFQKTFAGKLLTFAKLTAVQYGTNPKISLPTTSFLYVWNPLIKPPVLLSQTITVRKNLLIEAVYNKKKDQTMVIVKEKGKQIQKQIFTGLRVIQLTVDKGTVGYVI